MKSLFIDYPIHHLKEIPATEIPNTLPRIHPEQAGFRIQESKAVLIPDAWFTYLLNTDHEERICNLLHRVLTTGEDPEATFKFITYYLKFLRFWQIRRIADCIRFLLDTSKPIKDREKWDPFLEKLDAEANKKERLYRMVSHIEWIVPGPDYTLILFCRDQKLRFLDVSPLLDQKSYQMLRDPDAFRSVVAYYGAATWFPDDHDNSIDIDPDWCYANGIVVDLFSLVKAIRKENPIHSMDLHHLETPRLSGNRNVPTA